MKHVRNLKRIRREDFGKFPSPCGVVGMKHKSKSKRVDGVFQKRVSVPLRGGGSETRNPRMTRVQKEQSYKVSVPLRGGGSETVLVPKWKIEQQGLAIEVSVPLRGGGSETMRMQG